MTLTRTGPASFDVDQRKGGSQIVAVSYEVSGDGKKLTTVTTIASSGLNATMFARRRCR